jgi:nitroreductase
LTSLPPLPQDNDPLQSAFASLETLQLLALRRSTLAREMIEPGPSSDEIDDLIRISARVPDHGKLGPWRFIVFEGDARARFGEELAKVFKQDEPGADKERVSFERERLTRAPVVICVVSKVIPHPKAPKWEQVLCAGATCQTMLIGASAMGYGAQWITEWYAYHKEVDAALGLGEGEKVAGFIYLGTAKSEPTERRRASYKDRISHY